MTRSRLVISFFNVVFSLITIICLIFDSQYFPIVFVFNIIFLISMVILKHNEKIDMIKISSYLSNDLDPKKYINEYVKFKKKFIFSKTSNLLNKINIISIQISPENLEYCKSELESLVEEENKFTPVIRFFYYRAWVLYFFETNDMSKAKALLDELENIIYLLKGNQRLLLYPHLQLDKIKYDVILGRNLEDAELTYNTLLNHNITRINYIYCLYNLGIIAYKKKEYDNAEEKFKIVINNGNKLYVVNKAKKYLNKIKHKNES